MKAFIEMSQIISEKVQVISQQAEELLKKGCFLEVSDLFKSLEREISDLFWKTLLTAVFSDDDFRHMLRNLGARKGMKFISNQEIEVVLPSGNRVKIRSPFFVKTAAKRGRKKRGPQGRGYHLGLELFGFVNKVASTVAMEVIQMALLAPSFEVAARILSSKGITLSKNQVRKLSYAVGGINHKNRVKMTMGEGESLAGKRVFLLTDGGRVRSRKNKRGPIAKGKKGHGYYTNWVEPKLFAIYILDEEGNPIKGFHPHIDGTVTGDYQQMISLLENYLKTLEIDKAKEVILSADGAPWIWDHIPQLLKKLGVETKKLTEILDWTHAKQNLLDIFRDLPQKRLKTLGLTINKMKELLFNGDIKTLFEKVKVLSNEEVEKKIENYFVNNTHRMQYAQCRQKNIPIGSGLIESAIRRVINLRLKSSGSFWFLDNVEAILFLRATLLYGRWQIFVQNYGSQLVEEFQVVLEISRKIVPFPIPKNDEQKRNLKLGNKNFNETIKARKQAA